MGKVMKRLTAMLLLVCTLLSFVVPATFADGSEVNTYKYQITLYNKDNDQGYNSWFGSNQKISEIKDKLDEAYAAGTLNWTYMGSEDAANLTYRSGNAYTLRTKNGKKWTALKINVPEPGKYALTYSVDLAKATNDATIAAYAIPADKWSASEVATLLENANYSLGEVAMAATDASITFAEKDYAAGEYVIVYKATANTPIFLTELALVGTAGGSGETTAPTGSTAGTTGSTDTTAPEAQPVNYDFQLVTNSKFSVGSSDKFSKVENAIKTAYEAGTHNWKLEAVAEGVSTSSDMRFYGSDTSNEGLRLMNFAADEWLALRIKVDAAGEYRVSLTGGTTAEDYNYDATAWVVAAPAEGTMSATDVAAAMVDGNKLGTASITYSDKTAALGEYTFEKGEYVLILTVSNAARSSIADIDLTPKTESTEETTVPETTTAPETTTVPETTTPVETTAPAESTLPAFVVKDNVFNFKLYNYSTFEDPINGENNKFSKAAVKKAIEDAYTASVNNWVLEACGADDGDGAVMFSTADGLRMSVGVGNWIALRLNVAKTGVQEVVLNSINKSLSYTADVFLFPAPAERLTAQTLPEAMGAAMAENPSAHLGEVSVDKNNLCVVAGEYDVKQPGEYILFLGCVSSQKGGRMHLSSVELTELGGSVKVPAEPSVPIGPVYESGTFDFELYNNDKFSAVIDGDYTKYNKVATDVEKAYPAEHNWVIEGYSADMSQGGISFIGKGYAKAGDEGLRISAPEGEENKGNNWVAFRLNVTQAGEYDLVFNSLKADTYTASTWLFPARENTMSLKQLEAGMTDAYAMGDVKITKDATQCNIGTYNFQKGEYILLVKLQTERLPVASIVLTAPGNVELPPEDTRPVFAVKPDYFEMELSNYQGFSVLDKGYIEYAKAESLLAEMYPSKNNWILETNSQNLIADPNNKDDKAKIQFVGDGEGLRASTNAGVNGGWIALRLTTTKNGNYDLVINSKKSIFSGKVWMFPAPAEKMTAQQVEAAMTDQNYVGAMKFSSDVDSCNLGERTFKAGEYILVLKADEERVTLDSIAIIDHYVEVPKTPVDKVIYDMDLVKMDPNFNDKGFTNWYSRDENNKGILRVYQKIAQMYKEGTLNWKYESMSDTASRFNCRENHTQVKVSTNFSEYVNAWNAIRISAPGAGTYDVRLYSDELSSVIADIYLIPARTGVAMTNEEIEAAMTEKNLLVSNALIDGEDTFYLGEYTFGVEYEYVMAFRFTRGKKVYFNNIQLTKDGLVADTEVKKLPTYNGVVYDFDIGDKYTGILQPLGEYRYDAPTPKEGGYAAPMDQIKSFWNSGKINWKWIAASEDLGEYDDNMNQYPGEYIRFYQDTGMYVYSKPDSWVAFQIKSPGEGDFTLTMNHAVAPNDGTVAVYILPADTPLEEIYNTTDPSNRVGKVLLTKEDGSAGKEDGHESFVGYWNFEAGKEYILVLEAYEASQFSATLSNMNITNIVMRKGIHEYKTDDTKTVKPITVKQNVLATSDLGNGNIAVFEMNGMDYYLTQLEGGTINLYNLTTGELEKENFLATARPRQMAVAPDGKVWMTGAGKFLACYDPVENTVTKTKTFMPKEYKHNGFNYMTITPEGIIYAGLHLRSNVIKYDPSTKQFTDLGYFVDPDADITGLLYVDGYLYSMHYIAGVCNKAVKYNIATGKVEGEIDFIEHCDDQSCTHLSLLGDDIIVVGGKTTDNDHTMAFNKDTMEFVDLGLPGSVSKTVTSEINGKQYMVLSTYGLYEYDVETKEIIKTPGFTEMTGTGFRAGDQHSFGKSWATINGDLCLISNDSQVTSCPRVVNLTKKEYYRWTDLTRDASGGGSRIISFTETEPGAGELVMGHWNAEFISTYNIYTGEFTFMDSAGQTDSIGYYKGILYGGCYSATVLVELHRETEEIIQRFKLDHDLTGQKRLLSMETGGDHVFVGSVPGSFINGGALTVYNTITGQWYYERNLVQDQSIVDMAYSNELVFAASSREGGDNSSPAGDSAVIVAYDYLNREKLAVLDPRDYIPGLASPVHYIYGLTADPYTEENGRVWAIVSDTLFCFTFDRETKKFNVQEVFSLGKSVYTETSGVDRTQRKIEFIPEKNQMYLTLWGNGVYKMIIKDWMAPIGQVKITSDEKLMGYKPEDYIVAEDGNLYFGDEADLMMMPLNVTDEDWAIAEKMDAQIQAIHDSEITVASESAIRTARSDYENMAWRYKALVQNLELLQEAESDILECLIDEGLLKAGEIDADDYPALLALHEQYEALTTARQKRYVKNYKNLKEAYDLASSLNDQRIAAAMQEKVNALKNIMPIESLEKEPEVVAVRTEFDALPGRQRILVDTTILEEAEAQIAVLRQELVKEVEKLIQAIPAEITLEAEPAITAAREGVDKLYALERKQVSYTKLETAEAKLRNLKNALAKAEEFDALMKEIGIVTLGDAERIANARKVYNSLNETARAFCKKAGKLRRAEFILAGLQTWMIPVIVVLDLGAAFAVVWFVPSLHNKVFKAKKKEEEPVETEN